MRYTVAREGGQPAGRGRVLEVGTNLKPGIQDFEADFGSVSSLEADLLILAGSVFAADRGTPRGEREEYSREIELRVPVVNLGTLLPLVNEIEYVLRFLSDDAWTIELTQASGTPEVFQESGRSEAKTLLFSGGLDSLAAAVRFGREQETLRLVSHRTHNNVTDLSQRRLVEHLETNGFNVRHHQYFVSSRDGGPTPFDHDAENSQRTRSFMFLVLGALVARRTGAHQLMYLAENGQMAIHLPLTTARIGAFSTHTAHPTALKMMERWLGRALSIPLRVENPFLYLTKREVVDLITSTLPSAIQDSTSCWRNARLPPGISHCGECVPCQVRRIALEFGGVDPTRYARNLWAEPVNLLPPDDDGRRNVADLAEFVYLFRTKPDEYLMSEFPEMLSEDFDGTAVLSMYRRFADEARAVFGRYPALASLTN
jgi:7-cyano-7-deazaguanine synthase in queuosine biosynthesis